MVQLTIFLHEATMFDSCGYTAVGLLTFYVSTQHLLNIISEQGAPDTLEVQKLPRTESDDPT